MNKKEEIRIYLVRYLSEKIAIQLAKAAQNDSEIVDILWDLILENSYPVSWRAAWVFAKVAYFNKQTVESKLHLIPNLLNSFTHDGQKRELLRVVLLFPIEKQDMGLLLNTCFQFLSSSKESKAVKVHAMEIIYQISEIEPDIKSELKLMILQQIVDSDPGFKSRGTKILKLLSNVDVSNRI